MEKWKIAVIAALLLSLVGFGVYQQAQENKPAVAPTPAGTPLPSPYLGKTLPTWNFKTWSTQPVSLASLKGKPALVEIFRIQCPHCQDAAPFMVALQKRYGPRGLKIVAIESPGDTKDLNNPESKWPEVQAWMKKNGTNYPVALDEQSKYFQGAISKAILKGDESQLLYPTTLLLDSNSRVIMAHTGFQTDKPEGLTKVIELVVQLEKLFPTGKSLQENAVSLVKWLKAGVPDLQAEGPLEKALTDDIAQRLKK